MKSKSILALVFAVAPILSAAASGRDYASLVNTMQGTNNTYELSHGRCRPTVGLPHSMHLWNPTADGFQCEGFSIAFSDPSSERRVSEIGRPHLFSALYSDGTRAEATATRLCGYFKVRFGSHSSGRISLSGSPETLVKSPDDKEIRFMDGPRSVIVVFNKSFSKAERVGDNTIGVTFRRGGTLFVEVSFSELGFAQAERNMEGELGNKSFGTVLEECRSAWNKTLGQIEIEGGTHEQQKTFYSCLYRASLYPRKVYETDADGGQRYVYEGKVYKGFYHIHETFWDVAKCQLPLQNILNTEGQKEYLQSLQRSFSLTGWLPNGMIGNHASSVFADAWAKGIRSFDPDSALAAYYHEAVNSRLDDSNDYFIEHERGVGRFGWKEYFTLGYIPTEFPITKVQERTSRTMEYAYDDFCAMRLADMTSRPSYKEAFGRQVYNYKNVIDPKDHFPKARNAEGEWDPEFNPYQWGGPFVEGNAWHYKWCVNHDVQGLIDLVGGEKNFLREMDEMMEAKCDSIMPGTYGEVIHEINEVAAGGMGQYAPGNEPTFHVLYLYSYAGEPWKTQKYIRYSLSHHFDSSPSGFPGDDDRGSMSSFYVFSSMGFYPVTPGVTQYVLGSPLFSKAVIHLENGKDFTVLAQGNSPENVYIRRAELNGREYTHNWISHEDIMDGGTLVLEMSSEPEMSRGVSEEDKPYSVSRKAY